MKENFSSQSGGSSDLQQNITLDLVDLAEISFKEIHKNTSVSPKKKKERDDLILYGNNMDVI